MTDPFADPFFAEESVEVHGILRERLGRCLQGQALARWILDEAQVTARAARDHTHRPVAVDVGVGVQHGGIEASRDRSYRVMFLSALVAAVRDGSVGALALHLQTFSWQLATTGIQWMRYAMVAGGICGVPFCGRAEYIHEAKHAVARSDL